MSIRAAQPEGYYNLPVGAEFITLKGKAVPIGKEGKGELAGRREGGFFYPYLWDIGYKIHRREATQREQYDAAKPDRTAAPTSPVTYFNPDDARAALAAMASDWA